MILLGVDVHMQWIVVRFSERVVFSCCKIQCDTKVIDYFQVALHSD